MQIFWTWTYPSENIAGLLGDAVDVEDIEMLTASSKPRQYATHISCLPHVNSYGCVHFGYEQIPDFVEALENLAISILIKCGPIYSYIGDIN